MTGFRLVPQRSRKWPFIALATLLLIALAAVLWRAGAVQPAAPAQTAMVEGHAASAAARPVVAVAASAPLAPQRSAAADPRHAASAPRNVAVLNYDSADNLYALAVRAADARDPMVVYNGYLATVACGHLPRDELEALVAPGGIDAASAERVRTARLMLRRCAGFLDNDDSANFDLLRRLATKVRAAPGYYQTGMGVREFNEQDVEVDRDRELNAQDFLDIVDRGDWRTLMPLIQQSRRQASAPDGAGSAAEETRLVHGGGSFLAACDLGANCGPDSIDYAVACVMGKACDGSFQALLRNEATPGQWAAMQANRAEMMAALRRRDAAYFGFRP